MGFRYLVVDYNNSTQTDPRIALETDDLAATERQFEDSKSRRMDTHVIIHDTENDNISKAAIQSEPIFLVKAVELTRGHSGKKMKWADVGEKILDQANETVSTEVITIKAKKLAGKAVPVVGDAVLGHLIGDWAKAAGAAAAMFGGMSGGVIGTVFAGRVGALIGGIIGGVSIGVCTEELIRFALLDNRH